MSDKVENMESLTPVAVLRRRTFSKMDALLQLTEERESIAADIVSVNSWMTDYVLGDSVMEGSQLHKCLLDRLFQLKDLKARLKSHRGNILSAIEDCKACVASLGGKDRPERYEIFNDALLKCDKLRQEIVLSWEWVKVHWHACNQDMEPETCQHVPHRELF